jgi:hypothetical protein
MNFYVYKGDAKLGEEGLGSSGRHIWRDLKTLRGAINRAKRMMPNQSFKVYSFNNFYDDSTYFCMHTYTAG